MFQYETIYNLVPKEKILPPKEPLYRSKFPHDLKPTGSTLGLLTSSFPGVCNLNGDHTLVRGAHPMTSKFATFGRPDGLNKILPSEYKTMKENLRKKSPSPERLRFQSCEIMRKPKVPGLADKPIMGLKSDKNFITANAVDVILMVPKKHRQEEDDFLNKKNYGKIPEYIHKIKAEMAKEYEEIRENQLKSKDMSHTIRTLNEDEIVVLKEGLNKQLKSVEKEYGLMAHKTIIDTLVEKRKKETIEKKILDLEKDLKRLDKKIVKVDLTKFN